jgi:hypothetical protein
MTRPGPHKGLKKPKKPPKKARAPSTLPPPPEEQVPAPRLDFDALTPAQEAAIHNVAMSQEGQGHAPKVLKKLVDLGFIVARERNMGGHPPMTITVYEMPIAVHMQWAFWCASKYPEEEGPDG